MVLAVRQHASVDEFLGAAGAFLAAREAEHNLLFGIAGFVRTSPELLTEGSPTFFTVADAAGTVVAATLRTPPHNQVISSVDDLDATDVLVEALHDEPLPGVLAPKHPAARFVHAWTKGTGQAARLEVEQRIFRLTRVNPPERPTTGTWRLADDRDRDLIARWLVEFSDEAMPEAPPIPNPAEKADRWIAGVGRIGYVWEVDNEVVALIGAGGETPHGIRIGPVYTPPDRRGHGYASSLTAAASQDQLDRGRQFVFLFTDLANPTSNKIYRAIGYEPVCDVDQYRFCTNA